MPPMSHPSRPILAIDTAQHQPTHRHPIPVQQLHDMYPGDARSVSAPRPMPDTALNSGPSKVATPREFLCLKLSCVDNSLTAIRGE